MTPPLSWVWQYYERKEEKRNGRIVVVGYCKFCNESYYNNASRMENHLLVSKLLREWIKFFNYSVPIRSDASILEHKPTRKSNENTAKRTQRSANWILAPPSAPWILLHRLRYYMKDVLTLLLRCSTASSTGSVEMNKMSSTCFLLGYVVYYSSCLFDFILGVRDWKHSC